MKNECAYCTVHKKGQISEIGYQRKEKVFMKNVSRRDFLKGTAAGAAGLAAMGLLGGCSNQAAASGETKTVGLAGASDELYTLNVPNNGVDYWHPVYAGFKELGLLLGVKTSYTGSVEYSASAQVESFNQDLAKKPKGICVHPITAEAFQSPIADAVAAGTQIVTFAADAPDSARIGYVTSDNNKEGLQAAKTVGEAIGGKGGVMTTCNPGQTNHDIRVDVFREQIKALYPDVEVLDNTPTNQDADAAYQAVLTCAQKNPNLAAVFCPEATSAQGAATAAKELGTGIKVMCCDTNDAVLDMLKTGDFLAAIAPDQYVQGWMSMWLLFCAAHPELMNPMSAKKAQGKNPIYIPYLDNGLDVVTAETADNYYMANYIKAAGYSSLEDMLSDGNP